MEYKSKLTASEIDARLSKVFDSTLQTKEVEVSADTTIKADDGFLALKEVSVKVSGGGGTAPSGYKELRPSGWYWKATDEFLAKPLSTQAMSYEYMVAMCFIGEALDELNVLPFGTAYLTLGKMYMYEEGTQSTVRPLMYIQEVYAMNPLIPAEMGLISQKDYFAMMGKDETSFLEMMQGLGFIRITEEEYMEARANLTA